jgi:hypothetical protein
MTTEHTSADQAAQPLGVGSSEGLGPTLKPDGWAIGQNYYTGDTERFGNMRFGVEAARYRADQVRALLAARIEEAFRDGYCARETYNDMETSCADDQWAKAKSWLLRA